MRSRPVDNQQVPHVTSRLFHKEPDRQTTCAWYRATSYPNLADSQQNVHDCLRRPPAMSKDELHQYQSGCTVFLPGTMLQTWGRKKDRVLGRSRLRKIQRFRKRRVAGALGNGTLASLPARATKSTSGNNGSLCTKARVTCSANLRRLAAVTSTRCFGLSTSDRVSG